MSFQHTSQNFVKFTEMIQRLEYIGKIPNIKVIRANFVTGTIIVAMEGGPPASFDDMMTRIKFVEMTERLMVEHADFETGLLTVKVLDYHKTEDLSTEEVACLKAGHLITAIKLVRQRTNLGLRDAKNLVDLWVEKLRNDTQL